MCLVCHQMSTESGNPAGTGPALCSCSLNCPELHCGARQCFSDLWLLQSCSASSEAQPAAAKGRIQEEWGTVRPGWGHQMQSHALCPGPRGPLGGFDAQAWSSQGPCPWSYFVLRLHEFSIPLGKEFRALILKPNLDSWSKNPCLFSKV